MSVSRSAVEAHLAGLAEDMAERRPRQTLWVIELLGRGLTDQTFTTAAVTVGLAVKTSDYEGRNGLSWPKVADVSGVAWIRLRDECCRLLGLRWSEVEEERRAASRESDIHKRWLAGLRMYQAERGITP